MTDPSEKAIDDLLKEPTETTTPKTFMAAAAQAAKVAPAAAIKPPTEQHNKEPTSTHTSWANREFHNRNVTKVPRKIYQRTFFKKNFKHSHHHNKHKHFGGKMHQHRHQGPNVQHQQHQGGYQYMQQQQQLSMPPTVIMPDPAGVMQNQTLMTLMGMAALKPKAALFF